MLNQVLLYLGSAFISFWGIAHLFPTRSVVSGFGEISVDNKRIITMEWIIEGVALIFIGSINAIVTAMDHTSSISTLTFLKLTMFRKKNVKKQRKKSLMLSWLI